MAKIKYTKEQKKELEKLVDNYYVDRSSDSFDLILNHDIIQSSIITLMTKYKIAPLTRSEYISELTICLYTTLGYFENSPKRGQDNGHGFYSYFYRSCYYYISKLLKEHVYGAVHTVSIDEDLDRADISVPQHIPIDVIDDIHEYISTNAINGEYVPSKNELYSIIEIISTGMSIMQFNKNATYQHKKLTNKVVDVTKEHIRNYYIEQKHVRI